VLHYQARVFAFLARSSAGDPQVEDMAQEVFLRAIRALPDFTPDRAKVSTWLFQIAVRLLQDRRKKPRRHMVPVSDEIRDERLGPEETYARRRTLERIQAAARQLPEEQRVALVLFEFHNLSHEEIAQATGVAAATVKTRVFRARKFLKEALKKSQEHGS
jgi:RNA polymerase sigma-70 factor (ECF subfamily)